MGAALFQYYGVGVFDHCAEFEKFEIPALPPPPRVIVNYLPGTVYFYQRRDYYKKRHKKSQARYSEGHIKNIFHEEMRARQGRELEPKQRNTEKFVHNEIAELEFQNIGHELKINAVILTEVGYVHDLFVIERKIRYHDSAETAVPHICPQFFRAGIMVNPQRRLVPEPDPAL